jgi:hypothetical protein
MSTDLAASSVVRSIQVEVAPSWKIRGTDAIPIFFIPRSSRKKKKFKEVNLYETYHSHCFPEGVAEASQIFLRDAHVLPKLFRYE